MSNQRRLVCHWRAGTQPWPPAGGEKGGDAGIGVETVHKPTYLQQVAGRERLMNGQLYMYLVAPNAKRPEP